jgi:hypothetical protein
MSKEHTKDLLTFLSPFSEEKIALALWLRTFVWDLYPESNELIYDNYNAVAFGWSLSDKIGDLFCTIAVGRSTGNIHFGFYWGAQLSDPDRLLIGNGKQYRYLLVKNKEDFPLEYIKKLVAEAHANALSKLKTGKQTITGETITKSVSPVKRAKNH